MKGQQYKAVGILLGTLALSALPAHGQIVSYMDSGGKRVFVNADPTPAARVTKTFPRGFKSAAGTKPLTNQTPDAASPQLAAAELANRQKIEVMIREVSARYNVDPALIRAVIETESNWNSKAISRKGALGLMQLVPGTARQLGVKTRLIRSRILMVEFATCIPSWSGIMATWTRHLRHIMQVQAPWIEPGEFHGIAKRAITFRKLPIPTSGPAPIGFPMRSMQHVPFTAWWPKTDG